MLYYGMVTGALKYLKISISKWKSRWLNLVQTKLLSYQIGPEVTKRVTLRSGDICFWFAGEKCINDNITEVQSHPGCILHRPRAINTLRALKIYTPSRPQSYTIFALITHFSTPTSWPVCHTILKLTPKIFGIT